VIARLEDYIFEGLTIVAFIQSLSINMMINKRNSITR